MLTEASRTLDEVSLAQIFRDFFQWVPFNVVVKGAEKIPDKRQREYKADTKAAKQKRQPPESCCSSPSQTQVGVIIEARTAGPAAAAPTPL